MDGWALGFILGGLRKTNRISEGTTVQAAESGFDVARIWRRKVINPKGVNINGRQLNPEAPCLGSLPFLRLHVLLELRVYKQTQYVQTVVICMAICLSWHVSNSPKSLVG